MNADNFSDARAVRKFGIEKFTHFNTITALLLYYHITFFRDQTLHEWITISTKDIEITLTYQNEFDVRC